MKFTVQFLLAVMAMTGASAFADERGAAIFLGTAVDVKPVLANGVVSPRSMGCASCHGRDGLGTREGGVTVPAINWNALTRGRSPKMTYDAKSLAVALREGKTVDGSELDSVMPRYKLSATDLSSLLNYLQQVEQIQTTGITHDGIALAVVFANGQEHAAETMRLKAELAYRRLGSPRLHGRRLTFETVRRDDTEKLQRIFAIVLDVTADAKAVSDVSQLGIPSIGPLVGVIGNEDPSLMRSLFASRLEQWRALALAAPKDAIVITQGTDDTQLLQTVFKSHAFQDAKAWVPQSGGSVILPAGLDAQVLPQPPLPGFTIFTMIDGSTRSARQWIEKGVTLVLADARHPPAQQERNDYDRLASVVVEAVVRALAGAGRDVTRTSLMKSFDTLAFKTQTWQPVDFTKDRLSATSQVKLLRLDP